MSIISTGVAYRHANQQALFEGINFSVRAGQKVAIVGNNGCGKSTLLRILTNELSPSVGSVQCSSRPYYIPQQVGAEGKSVAEVLGVAVKIAALKAIENGSSNPAHFDALADDWGIEAQCRAALDYWGLTAVTLDTLLDRLSGGERTKVYLAGLIIHAPEVVLLDEPTNHLDAATRTKLYSYISASKSTIVVVSHDVTLLLQINTTYELSEKGLRLYSGNYDFYCAQKELEEEALAQHIGAEETALKQARRKAQEVYERQEKRSNRAGKISSGVPRIILNARHDKGENTGAKLAEKHAGIIGDSQQKLTELRQKQRKNATLKINFDDAALHNGKLLIATGGINFGYTADKMLWPEPLQLEICSGERVHLQGGNGSGKTTLVKLLTGELAPTIGEVRRAPNFSYLYFDQQYSQVFRSISVLELAREYNLENLQDHEVKIRLNRALFPAETWDKSCLSLSGGERMRLYLCCLMLSNHIPDMLILDEPSNNLDLASLATLTETVKNYRGTLIVISHDSHFTKQVGVTKSITL
ncbi:MAG: ATP-binding cassette domain-containing protein [Prevotellaceae bacterium]|nr:ATP-binding cassette domain-containing protein [Prevotellaceae bacterium]